MIGCEMKENAHVKLEHLCMSHYLLLLLHHSHPGQKSFYIFEFFKRPMTCFQAPSSSYYYNSLGHGGYSFAWNVIDAYSGNDYGHREDRGLGKSGTDETRGSYHVLLPDGRVQTVTYFVDPYNGYQVSF